MIVPKIIFLFESFVQVLTHSLIEMEEHLLGKQFNS